MAAAAVMGCVRSSTYCSVVAVVVPVVPMVSGSNVAVASGTIRGSTSVSDRNVQVVDFIGRHPITKMEFQ